MLYRIFINFVCSQIEYMHNFSELKLLIDFSIKIVLEMNKPIKEVCLCSDFSYSV
jgi:hypothetical protein